MADKPEGMTFNIKEPGATRPDGKKDWGLKGRSFVTFEPPGGAVWLGTGDAERKYILVHREGPTKSAGLSFDVMERVEGEGKTILKRYARLFVRATKKGGAMWVGEGESEVEYALFPHQRKPKAESPSSGASDSADAPAPA